MKAGFEMRFLWERVLSGEMIGIALFMIGLYGLIARRNIVKTIICIGIMEMGIILFFLTIHAQPDARPPIGENGIAADPVPQALMITAIVIGVAVTAVALIMFIGLYHKYGTTNWKKARQMRREEN